MTRKKDKVMTLATELLHEIKITARRWFIAFIIMCVVEILTVAGFLWYISLPTDISAETTQNVEQDSAEGDNTSTIVGGDYGTSVN